MGPFFAVVLLCYMCRSLTLWHIQKHSFDLFLTLLQQETFSTCMWWVVCPLLYSVVNFLWSNRRRGCLCLVCSSKLRISGVFKGRKMLWKDFHKNVSPCSLFSILISNPFELCHCSPAASLGLSCSLPQTLPMVFLLLSHATTTHFSFFFSRNLKNI